MSAKCHKQTFAGVGSSRWPSSQALIPTYLKLILSKAPAAWRARYLPEAYRLDK
jgi:hypothetical protein